MATPGSSSTVVPTIAEVDGEVPARQEPKLTSEDVRNHPLFLLYLGHLKSQVDAPDVKWKTFMKLCLHFN